MASAVRKVDIHLLLVTIIVLLVLSARIEGCPNGCKCSRTKVFCKYSEIKSPSYSLPATTEHLSMEGGNAIRLDSTVFGTCLSGMLNLKLINMNIQEISPKTFVNLKKLESMIIKTNNITQLVANTFEGLNKLYYLDLSYNRIVNLEPGVFQGLELLRHFDLSHNYILEIGAGMFNGLTQIGQFETRNTVSVLKINLYGKGILSIHEDAFKGLSRFTDMEIGYFDTYSCNFRGLSSLRRLRIAIIKNQQFTDPHPFEMNGLYNLRFLDVIGVVISYIPERFLKDSIFLRQLSLVWCSIKTVYPGSFAGLVSLNDLNLHSNMLTGLDNFVFEELIALKKLNLSKNYISTVQKYAFKNLKQLRFIDLTDNELISLKPDIFSHLPMLKDLKLGNNPLDNINEAMISGLTSLKILDFLNDDETIISNTTILCNSRLDTFRGSGHASGLQVLKSLALKIDAKNSPRDDLTKQLQQWTQNIFYLRDPIDLKIYNLEHLSYLHNISEYNIEILQLYLSGQNINLSRKNFIQSTTLKKMTVGGTSINSIQKETFYNLHNLEYLHITYNNDTILEKSTFWQQGLIEFLHYLTLDRDSFQKILDYQFPAFNFIFYQRRESKRFKLHANTFLGLINLNNLLVYGIRNSALNPNIFNGLENLNKLIISESSITFLNNGAFRHLRKIREIDLHSNEISRISKGAFHGLGLIQTLILRINRISRIGTGIFGSICNVNFTLSCGNLTRLSSFCNTSFALTSLKDLDLSVNRIEHIHPHAFLGCSSLENLILSTNKMLTLDIDYLFTPKLRHLVMDLCNISILKETTFLCTVNLEIIFFDQNENLKPANVSVLEHLKHLKLIVFPIKKPDCEWKTLWQWLRSRNIMYYMPHGNSKMSRSHYEILGNFYNADILLSRLLCNNTSSVSNRQPSGNKLIPNKFQFFKTYIEPIILIFLFLCGSIGNGLLLFLILYHSDMSTKHNICIAHLATVDIISLILNLGLGYWDVVNITWTLGETWCKVFIMSKDIAVALMVSSVIALSFERWLVVRTSFKMKSACGVNNKPVLYLLSAWIFSVLSALPSYGTAIVQGGRCLFCQPQNKAYIKRIWACQLLMYCVVPSIFILYYNVSTTLTLKKSIREAPQKPQNTHHGRNRNTVAYMVSILAVVFICSYSPNFILRTLVSFSVFQVEDLYLSSFITYCLFFFHTIFNPIAIIVMGAKFKSHIHRYMTCFTEEQVPATENVQKELKNVSMLLFNLAVGLGGHKENLEDEFLASLETISEHDERVRLERKKRLKKLGQRFL